MADDLNEKPPCADCIRARGLCSKCARTDHSLLPQLAVNAGWLKLIGDAMCEQRKRQNATPDPEAARIRARKERKRAKRATSPPRPSKLERRLRGEHTRAA